MEFCDRKFLIRGEIMTSLIDLPPEIVCSILNRLSSSGDLARCRLTCRFLYSLSASVSTLSLRCSRHRFRLARAHQAPPFTSLLPNLLSILPYVCSLSLGVDGSFGFSNDGNGSDDDEEEIDDLDDLHLTSARFLEAWMKEFGWRLTSLAISDYWRQSCWRRSEALAVISHNCCNLTNLELRNAWVSLEDLKSMWKLTALTLEFIRLDDENLEKINYHFPSLEVLNLIGVGGLKDPKIYLPHLKICNWIVSNFPLTLTIDATNLVVLNLSCVEPKLVVIKAPLLRDLNLAFNRPTGIMDIESFPYLSSLKIKSSDLLTLVQLFNNNKTVKKLELEVPEGVNLVAEFVSLHDLINGYPNLDYLILGNGVLSHLERSVETNSHRNLGKYSMLKKLVVHLPPLVANISSMSLMLNYCDPSCEVTILFHAEASDTTTKHLVSMLHCNFPMIRWNWGMQK